MKQELLEQLTRMCVREVLSQLKEEDADPNKKTPDDEDSETKGAPAPPADGQGTAEQPEIPKSDTGEEIPGMDDPSPNKPEEPTPSGAGLKGVILVNPRDKSQLQQVPLKGGDDASLERNLYRLASTLAGSKVKVALSTQRVVKDAIRNPNSSVYLYLGKYDPSSDEIFLMSDKSLKVAKDTSISPSELTGTPDSCIAPGAYNPAMASDADYVQHVAQGVGTPRYGIDEHFNRVIKKMVKEIINNR
jgi:hypothetical protein